MLLKRHYDDALHEIAERQSIISFLLLLFLHQKRFKFYGVIEKPVLCMEIKWWITIAVTAVGRA